MFTELHVSVSVTVIGETLVTRVNNECSWVRTFIFFIVYNTICYHYHTVAMTPPPYHGVVSVSPLTPDSDILNPFKPGIFS